MSAIGSSAKGRKISRRRVGTRPARRSFEATLERDPALIEARIELAEVLHQSGSLSAAVDAYPAAVARRPRTSRSVFATPRHDDRVDDAILKYERLVGLDASLAEAHFHLAALLLQ